MMPVLIEVSFNLSHSFLFVVVFYFIEYLKDTLEQFVKELPVSVNILRNKERLGLMKSRLKGKIMNKTSMKRFLCYFYRC